MDKMTPTELARQIRSGDLVPILGPGALAGVRDTLTGTAIPADSDSLSKFRYTESY